MSGEIIQMSNKQNMIFEPRDLEQASPATVSRCGMIYFDPAILGEKSLIKAWLDNSVPKFLLKSQLERIHLLCNWLIEPCLDFVLKNCDQFVYCSRMHLTMNFIKLFSSMLEEVQLNFEEEESEYQLESNETNDEQASFGASLVEQKTAEEKNNMILCYFFFSIVWSIGGNLKQNSREKFDVFFRDLLELTSEKEKHAKPKDLQFPKSLLPPKRDTIYDFIYIRKQYGSWNSWSTLLEPQIIAPNAVASDCIISTTETLKQTFFLDKLLMRDKQVLLIGPTGTGKSAITNAYLLKLPKDKYLINNINFSAQTTSNQTQDIILSKLDRRRKGVYGPTQGKKAIIFVDDLNMPAQEKYGAQPPVEILRQLVDHKFWYDRKENFPFEIIDSLLVAAMGPPGGGRNQITSRLTRHFSIISIESFNDELLKSIFYPILDWHFRKPGFEVQYQKYSRVS